MYNIIPFLYQATIVLTVLRCTYLAHSDLSFSRYTFPLQCKKRYSSVKFSSLSCYMAFLLFFLFSQYTIPLQCSKRYFYLSEVIMVLTYQLSIYLSFAIYVVNSHFEAKIQRIH